MYWGQTHRRQPSGDWIDPDLGVKQHMRHHVDNGIPPRGRRQFLDEPVAPPRAQCCPLIHNVAGTEADHLKPGSVDLRQPAFQEQLEQRVVAEKAADDTDPNPLTGPGSFGQRRGRFRLGNCAAGKLTIRRLQVPIVEPLIR